VILSIETSTDVCSVAIHGDGQLIASSSSTEAYSHAEKLAPMIDAILKDNKIDKKKLSAVAVSAGPGSYTGLRIGTSTAKGLCYALDIPLIAVGTLESMLEGHNKEYDKVVLCPMIDARRMEVYCILGKSGGEIIEKTQAKIINENSFIKVLKDTKVVFYGNGADKCKSVISHKNASFISDIVPSAINIGKLAAVKFTSEDFADLVYFEPEYLKPFHVIKAKNPLL
jgi:tRNA threonylcarbamoyladenosine biosynthesis protein TsaB